MRAVLARLAVAVIALGAIGWLAVMERDARLYERGIAAGGSLDDPDTIARAEARPRGRAAAEPRPHAGRRARAGAVDGRTDVRGARPAGGRRAVRAGQPERLDRARLGE